MGKTVVVSPLLLARLAVQPQRHVFGDDHSQRAAECHTIDDSMIVLMAAKYISFYEWFVVTVLLLGTRLSSQTTDGWIFDCFLSLSIREKPNKMNESSSSSCSQREEEEG